MPSLSKEQRARLLVSTQTAAHAFQDDIRYIRNLLETGKMSPGDIRRMSGILRRLLVERDIALISTARMGRIKLKAPDNSIFYQLSKKENIEFFSSGRVPIFGCWLGHIYVANLGHVTQRPTPEEARRLAESRGLPAHFADHTVDVRLDGFLSQKVLLYHGVWISRGATIKFLANIESGVHSGSATTPEELALAAIRRSMVFTITNGEISIERLHDLGNDDPIIRFSRNAFDVVLVEVLAAAKFLIESPDIRRLEEIVEKELN